MNKYTDQEFTYRETPVSYDGIAKLDSVKGNTVAWNQLCTVRNTITTNGITMTNNGDGSVTINGTATADARVPISIIAFGEHKLVGHKILFRGITGGSASTYYQTIIYVGELAKDIGNGAIWTVVDTPFNGNLGVFVANGESVDVTYIPILFDLTQMFGSGNEPSTVEEFTSLYPLPYYSYNSGTLVNFNGNGIRTTDSTLSNDSSLWGNYGVSATGYEANTGRLAPYGQTLPCVIGETYTISLADYQSRSWFVGVTIYDATTRIVDSGWQSLPYSYTVPSGAVTVRIAFRKSDYSSLVSVVSEIGKDLIFELYTETQTTDLPISAYFPTGLKSAGDVYDELTSTKAITRIGAVDLGTLNWSMIPVSQGTMFRHGLVDMALQTSALANALCVLYPTVAQGVRAEKTLSCAINSRNIDIIDSTYSSAEAFKSAMSGVYLNYELATPTEQDINADLFYKFYGDGTEEILPTNGSTPTTSAFFGDIEYYDSTEGDTPYRKFWLINGKGDRWDFTEHELKTFLNNPTGMGFKKTFESVRYGEKLNKTNEVYNFPQPQGELLFYDTYNSTRYDKYNKFIRFLMDQPITLYYMIPVSYISGIANIFTLECEVTEVQKTESKPDGFMRSTVVFNGTSFYEGDSVSINGTANTYTLTNEGDFPVGFEITIEGNMTNPYITLEQNDELYGEAKFDDETAFNSVYVNSNDGEQNIILEQGGSVLPNPLSYQDLSISNGSIYVTFIKLARGESTLTIGMDNGSLTDVKIKFTPKYRSV